jgi:hypothetical protein
MLLHPLENVLGTAARGLAALREVTVLLAAQNERNCSAAIALLLRSACGAEQRDGQQAHLRALRSAPLKHRSSLECR